MRRQEKHILKHGTRQNLRKELNEMEIRNLVGKEFKIMIIKMLNEHRKHSYGTF